MALRSEQGAVFRDDFGVSWRVRLVSSREPAGAAGAGGDRSLARLRSLLYFVFGPGAGHAGAPSSRQLDGPFVVLLAAYDALTGRRLSQELVGSSASASSLAAWRGEIEDTLLAAARQGALRVDEERAVATPFFIDDDPLTVRSPPPVVETLSFVTLRVVDEVGDPIDGIDVAFGVGADRKVIATDGSGLARLENVATGFVSASIAKVGQLREKLAPRWKAPREPKKVDDPKSIVRELGEGVNAPLSLTTETVTSLVITPFFKCHEVPGAHFAFGRSFVLSLAIENLATIAEDLSSDEERKGMVFGHTDLAGTAALNKELSERRAKAVLALFTHDADAWEELFSGTADGPHWKEKWDLEEAQHMLNALHVSDDQGKPINEKGVRDAPTKQAIRRFRSADYPEKPAEQAPLPPSDFLGKDGRKELFLAYAKLISRKPIDRSRFQLIGDSSFMGCGAFNPLSLSARDAESRRTQVFVFHGAAGPADLPCRLRKLGPCNASSRPLPTELDAEGPPFRCKVYQALSKKCPCQGGIDLSHDLVVRVPFPLEVVNGFGHRLVLESDDGTISQTKVLESDARALDTGESEVFFSSLPPAHQYRMRAEGVPEPYEVFPFTAFEDLSTITAAVTPDDEASLTAAALAVEPAQETP
jgi:outer membrane protein OmpA-like peptidoglycan-associated protein